MRLPTLSLTSSSDKPRTGRLATLSGICDYNTTSYRRRHREQGLDCWHGGGGVDRAGPMTQARKVLVVDDEPAILKVLRIKLRVSGFDVTTATDGQQALELVRVEPPDIMLLDLVMPRKDGFDVLRELRAFSQMPVIVFSARPENAQLALDSGANAFLPKPFDVDELVQRIRYLLASP